MKIKFLTDGRYDTPGIVGKIVEATADGHGGFKVKLSELAPLDKGWQDELELPTSPDYTFYFFNREVEVVEE